MNGKCSTYAVSEWELGKRKEEEKGQGKRYKEGQGQWGRDMDSASQVRIAAASCPVLATSWRLTCNLPQVVRHAGNACTSQRKHFRLSGTLADGGEEGAGKEALDS